MGELVDLKKKWSAEQSQKNVELISFRASEETLNRLEAILSQYPGVSQSMMLRDLVNVGLSFFESSEDGKIF